MGLFALGGCGRDSLTFGAERPAGASELIGRDEGWGVKPLESFVRQQTSGGRNARRARPRGVTSALFHWPEIKQAGPGPVGEAFLPLFCDATN